MSEQATQSISDVAAPGERAAVLEEAAKACDQLAAELREPVAPGLADMMQYGALAVGMAARKIRDLAAQQSPPPPAREAAAVVSLRDRILALQASTHVAYDPIAAFYRFADAAAAVGAGGDEEVRRRDATIDQLRTALAEALGELDDWVDRHGAQIPESGDRINCARTLKALDVIQRCTKADDDALRSLSSPPPAVRDRGEGELLPPGGGEIVRILYRNWRGETAERRVIPLSWWYGETERHPSPQWHLKAIDMEKRAERDFALDGVLEGRELLPPVPPSPVPAAAAQEQQHNPGQYPHVP